MCLKRFGIYGKVARKKNTLLKENLKKKTKNNYAQICVDLL